VSGPVIGHQGSSLSQLAPPPGRAGTGGWAATGGWQGSSLGEMQPATGEPFRSAIAPAPKPPRTAAKAAMSSYGPPWAPAPEPERVFGPLPSTPNSAQGPDLGPSIRVPGDMATIPAVPPDAMLPAPFDVSALPDPDFPPRPAANGIDGEATGPGGPGGPLPTRRSLGFAAAPVPVDYAPPPTPDFTVPSRAAGLLLSADNGSSAASGSSAATDSSGTTDSSGAFKSVVFEAEAPAGDPSFIWHLAATDVFPAATDPGPPTEAPGAVPEDGDPGAS